MVEWSKTVHSRSLQAFPDRQTLPKTRTPLSGGVFGFKVWLPRLGVGARGSYLPPEPRGMHSRKGRRFKSGCTHDIFFGLGGGRAGEGE